jgi:RNA polymerase sigma-70 factor (ECF subfamily)
MTSSPPPASSLPGSTSSSLLEQVVARQPQAWSKLSRLYGPLVYRWARQQGLQDADAADVVQEVFRTVAARIEDFRHEAGGSFRGWLWTICRNKLGDHFRRRAGHPRATGGSDALEQWQQLPEQAAAEATGARSTNAEAALVQRALQLLHSEFEERTWRAFWRTAVDGQPAVAVAAELGMTPRAVRQARYRVLRRLRAELEA